MKKLSLLLVFFLSVSLYAKEIPTPFWYSISEKILTGTHQLISPEDSPCKANCKAKVKVKAIKVPLKCQPKREKNILPTPFITINTDGIWSELE
jgi:hypothetical protein